MLLLIDAIFWLALATWFGSVLFKCVAPPVIFKSVLQADPTLPRVLSVNLDRQHSTLLAGQVVSDLVQMLFRIEVVCMIGLGPALAGKWLITELTDGRFIFPTLVTALYVLAVVYEIYAWRVVWPRVMLHREKYIEFADDPDVANAELDLFDRYSTAAGNVTRNLLFVLMGMVLFSAALVPRAGLF
jgi:hypothetical protein